MANLNRLIEKLPPNEQKSQKIIMDGIIKEQQVIVLNDSDDEQGNNDDVKIGVSYIFSLIYNIIGLNFLELFRSKVKKKYQMYGNREQYFRGSKR